MFTFAVTGTSLYVHHILTQQGVVTGILYAMEQSSAIIDNQVVRQGDVIYDVQIINIEKFTVEFEKNGYQWKQRVREKPNPAWKYP